MTKPKSKPLPDVPRQQARQSKLLAGEPIGHEQTEKQLSTTDDDGVDKLLKQLAAVYGMDKVKRSK